MSFDWPDLAAVNYRLWRLRRLIVLSWLCVVLGAFVGQGLAGSWDYGGHVAVLFAGLTVTLHVLVFPNATSESVGLALCLPVVLFATAPAAEYLQRVSGLGDEMALGLTSFVMVIALAIGTGIIAVIGGGLSQLGPVMAWQIKASGHLACSCAIAKQQFALVPQSRRGRILTGEANPEGIFDVAVASAQARDPRLPDLPLVARLDARVVSSGENHHDVMLFLQNGRVTVTRQAFRATDDGCEVTITDLPGDFTFGMHLRFWLLDMAQDNLTEVFDVIEGRPERSIGLMHGQSLGRIFADVLMNLRRDAG